MNLLSKYLVVYHPSSSQKHLSPNNLLCSFHLSFQDLTHTTHNFNTSTQGITSHQHQPNFSRAWHSSLFVAKFFSSPKFCHDVIFLCSLLQMCFFSFHLHLLLRILIPPWDYSFPLSFMSWNQGTWHLFCQSLELRVRWF